MTVAKRRPRNRSATVARRREILDAALEIFGNRGFASGTLQEIADRVGMTHAGILHHFGSKDQLLMEVLTHRDSTDVAELEGQHIPEGLLLFRHLVATAKANAHRAGVVQAFAVLSGESVTEGHPAQAYFQERYHNLRELIAEAFEVVCADHGVTTPETVAAASAAILAVMDGLQVQWLLTPDEVDLAASTEFAIEAIVNSVLTQAPSPLA